MPHPEQWLRATIEKAAGVPVFPVMAPEEQRPPFVVYQRSGTTRERHTLNSAGVPLATFTVWIHADGYLEGKDLAALVRRGVDNFKGEAAGVTIDRSFLQDESDGDPVDFAGEGKPSYTVNQVYEVRYLES